MKYLVSLMLIILIGYFLYPVASSSICERTHKQYNVLDILTGKPTDDLYDCINKVMEDYVSIPSSPSASTSTSYSSPASPDMISNSYVKPQLVQVDVK